MRAELRIGRGRSGRPTARRTGSTSGAADDPALSRLHAVLRAPGRRDSYAIEDVGSTNGTEVNGRALPSHDPVTLADGDRIQLGAWTTMTVVASTAAGDGHRDLEVARLERAVVSSSRASRARFSLWGRSARP